MQPTFITKEHFVSVLDALQEQYLLDKKNADVLGLMFKTEVDGAYDNSLLSNAILGLLREYFPKEDGHCEIEHWAYQLQFGKYGEEYEDAGQLYDRLQHEKGKRLYADLSALSDSISGNKLVIFDSQPCIEETFTASPCIDQLINAKKEEE